jgi:hypothetical protein
MYSKSAVVTPHMDNALDTFGNKVDRGGTAGYSCGAIVPRTTMCHEAEAKAKHTKKPKTKVRSIV